MCDSGGNARISTTGNGEVQGPKWEWITSHDQRLKNLLLSGFQSDLTLVLGQKGLKVPVHRIFLQAGSQVLNSKITKSTEQLIIKNVDTRIFQLLLNYFYTGKSQVEMIDALELMQLATEYEVSGLRDNCATILIGDLSVESVLPLFQSGMLYAHGDLIQSTLKFICKNAKAVLQREEFTKLRQECLIEIIQQDSLKVLNEMVVFEAVHRWGVAECKRKNLDPTVVENLKSCLAKPLNYVRFSLMDPSEFALNVITKKILSTEESMELLASFLIPQRRSNLLPPGQFLSNPRNFICGETTVTRSIVGNNRSISDAHSGGNANGSETIMIRASENVLLKSISIPKKILQSKGPYVDYFYDLVEATLTISNGSDAACKLDNKIDTTLDNDLLKICLKPPYQVYKHDGWTGLRVTLSGQVGYSRASFDLKRRTNMSIHNEVFPENTCNRVVTNYGSFKTHRGFLNVEIKRPELCGPHLSYGFIEELELTAF
ncbi:BTB/POZ domain-containing protein 6-B isoform X1 [Folsomia candida]|uniref:BTB/POZ domain-containing protein 6-B isoform X1 n=1 Tax=Folsomia candida TaxID=158441 RepID=UPI001604EE4E|nr:BTB/POZ domain-containing protein 6-B isoform X1 [Folsomia candida]XP_035713963.1 BTB/POZ domain-containing protein 6-B isoform X1 [Folsomia candida]